jgi:hypothetical protein
MDNSQLLHMETGQRTFGARTRKVFVYFFFENDRIVDDFNGSFLARMLAETHETVFIPIMKHDLFKPISPPEPYNAEDHAVILLGDHVPFKCHFDFLPPPSENEEDRKKQMSVGVIIEELYTDPRPDYSGVVIGVPQSHYYYSKLRELSVAFLRTRLR